LIDYGEGASRIPGGILLRRQQVARGETIFREGAPFRSIFAVKSGSFKSLICPQEGGDQVVGFHFAGELIGTDGVADDRYTCTATALEPSSVCELRLERLPETGRPLELLQQGVIALLGQEVAFNHSLGAALIRQNGDQRVAAFLLNVSRRLHLRGMPCLRFYLNMSRTDIASYLGLAGETVSRMLTRFQREGVLALRRKHVQLLNLDQLALLAGAPV
jgi:CRP/FNR family transcriptional regulator